MPTRLHHVLHSEPTRTEAEPSGASQEQPKGRDHPVHVADEELPAVLSFLDQRLIRVPLPGR